MTNRLLVDSENRRLIMDKTFARNAQIVGSVEYDMLQRARSDYATYSVVTRQIKRNPNKESYRGLTYQYMEDYIAAHEDYETAKAVLDEFEERQLISQCHSKAFRYPTIKKWFLERYLLLIVASAYNSGSSSATTAVEPTSASFRALFL